MSINKRYKLSIDHNAWSVCSDCRQQISQKVKVAQFSVLELTRYFLVPFIAQVTSGNSVVCFR